MTYDPHNFDYYDYGGTWKPVRMPLWVIVGCLLVWAVFITLRVRLWQCK